ncbi:MAG: nucleotidyl transferase AbiEii/AbiGii toxin family protein [Candidatus Eisenbacteria sp.]|nr:nucleotidyl transferase AbiEii/AbiGii toxin family protein [Candidatus Eisenbacteria bacterium]
MRVPRDKLIEEARKTGFRAEILEKVVHLLPLLAGLHAHPFLRDRLALKGGTALNLFVFDCPRLSVDIDLNYVGSIDLEDMLVERPRVEEAVRAVCSREGLATARVPTGHAGGKWRLRYLSAFGGGGNLEVDLNFMFRVPLWPVTTEDSRTIGSFKATAIPIVDIHELAAGKLADRIRRHPGLQWKAQNVRAHRKK